MSVSSKSSSNSPNKENKASKSNSIDSNIKRSTSRQQTLLKQKEEKDKNLLIEEIEKLDLSLKESRNLFDEKCRVKKIRKYVQKFKLLKESRTYLMELGMDRMRNKYYWSLYGDGRIFIMHSNTLYHQIDRYKDEKFSICKELILRTEKENKCCNEWEELIENENKNEFCWSFISKSSDFYTLLSILDKRGIRESELLLCLNALKSDIIKSMEWVGNDDYKQNENHNIDIEEDAPKKLRRSKRKNNTVEYDEFIQSTKQDFTSYRNKLKWKNKRRY